MIAEYLGKRGEEKGKRNAMVKVARNLLKDGFEPSMIIKYTGLSHDEINGLMQP